MKTILQRVFIPLILTLFFVIPASATHFAGGEITLEPIVGNTYQVTLNLYRDCGGIQFGPTQNVQIFGTCGSTTGPTLNVSVQRISVTDITPLCGIGVSTCSGGSTPGIEKHVYKANVTLNPICPTTTFNVRHNSCCRTNAITNLTTPGNEGYTLNTQSTSTLSALNSTPTFLNDPVVYWCVNQANTYSPGAVDADGDSLVYSLTDAIGQNLPVAYATGFSSQQPFGAGAPVTLDPVTGQLTVTPTSVSMNVLAIKVEEYRNGVKIGEVIRDINIVVQSCNNGLPTSTGINGTGGFSTTACPGETATFTLPTSDVDGDATTITWNQAIPSATFTTNSAINQTGTFNWTPGPNDGGFNTFSIFVSDGACPVPGVQVYAVTVFVDTLSGTVTTVDAQCGNSGSASIVTDPGNQVTWSNGATGLSVTGLAAGSYSAYLSSLSGCLDTINFTINSVGTPPVIVDSVFDPPCANVCGASITIQPVAGSNPSATWSDGGSGFSRTGLCAGTYTVTVNDGTGCTTTKTYTIGALPPLTATNAATDHDCSQSSLNGSIDVTPSGGTPPYSYAWSNGATSEDVSGLAPGTYSFTITSADGICTFSDTVSVGTSGSLQTFTSGNSTSCGLCNGSAMVMVQSGIAPYAYTWSNGGNTSSISALCQGSYMISVIDAVGCTGPDVAVVHPSSPLTISSTVNDHTCGSASFSGSISLSPSGGLPPYTYSWSSGATTKDISGIAPGTYTVQVGTSDPNCSTSDTFTVGITGSLTPALATTATTCGECNGEAIATVSGVSQLNYNWTVGSGSATPGNTDSIGGLCAGRVNVQVTDGAGCSGTISSLIGSSIGLKISASAIGTTCNLCNGEATVTVNSGNAPYTYAWSNGDTNPTAKGLCAGTYTVTVTDDQGCSATATVTVKASKTPSVSAKITHTTCGNCDGAIDITSINTQTPISYAWSNGSRLEDQSKLCAGTYIVRLVDGSGCVVHDTFTVDSSVAVTLSTVEVNTSCGQCNGGVDLTVVTGTPPYSYSWTNGATTEDLSGLCAGGYNVDVVDSEGCKASTKTSIAPSKGISAKGSSDPVSCFGDCDGVAEVSYKREKAGPGAYSVLWSNGGTGDIQFGLCAGTYTATVTDPEGCTDTVTVVVGSPQPLTTGYLTTKTACGSACTGTIDLIVMGGTPPYTYSWSNGATTEDLSGLCDGVYEVTVTDSAGCSTTQCVTVEKEELQVTIEATNPTCANWCNGRIKVIFPQGSPGPHRVKWSNGRRGKNAFGFCAGTYTATITDGSGCRTVQTVTLTSPAPLNLSMNVTPPSSWRSCNGSVDLTVTGGTPPYSYFWTGGNTNQDLTNACARPYIVWVTDSNGCSKSSFVRLYSGGYNIFWKTLESNDLDVVVFPNPTEGNFKIEFNYDGDGSMVNTKVVDVTGREITAKDIEIQQGVNSISYELGDVAPGTYLLEMVFESDGAAMIETIIVK